TQTPLLSPSGNVLSGDTGTTFTGEEEQDGNCILVENSPKIISKIPDSVTYFSVSCQNSEFSDMDVEKWVGIFPADLLQGNGQGFKLGNRFSIVATDQGDPEEGAEAYQTLFTGDKFLKSPLTGRWGSSSLDSEDDEEDNDETIVAYKVELVNSETSKNFYIFKPE
ncbi:hypothetical protein DNK47_02930, partial [Mycoplasma wenyonii]